MFRLLGKIFSIFVSVAGVIGLFTLPEDIQVASEKLGRITWLLSKDNVLLALFSTNIVIGLYSIFVPGLKSWAEQRKTPPLSVEFNNDCNLEHKHPEPFKRRKTYFSPELQGVFVTRTEVFLGVRNSTSRTINKVSVKVYYSGIPLSSTIARLPNEDGSAGKVSIEPEGIEWFMLGYYIRNKFAPVIPSEDYSADQIKAMIEEHKNYGILVPNFEKSKATIHLRNDGIKFYIQVLGENVKPTYVEFVVNAKEKDEILLLHQSTKEWRLPKNKVR